MFNVFGFYKFKKLTSLKKNKVLLQDYLIKKDIRGTIIIANEGINATISGKAIDLKSAITKIKKVFNFKKFDSENISKSKFQPFHKPKVKIKKEVVPMGLSLSSKNKKDNHVDPKKWNKLINDKETLVLDSRKPFEYNVGTFKGSVNPDVDNFREFPKYLNKLKKTKPIAMFCTGGIRCEKASVFLEKKGFKNIYQLKGGILNYLKNVNDLLAAEEERWLYLTNNKNNLFLSPYEYDYLDPSNFYGIFYDGGRHSHNLDSYDKLVAEADAHPDYDVRLKLYESAEMELINNVSIIPLMHPITTSLIKESVKGDGPQNNTLGFAPLNQRSHYFFTHITK